jgi:hypothetical protein
MAGVQRAQMRSRFEAAILPSPNRADALTPYPLT